MADTAPKKKKIKVPKVVNGIETMVEIEVDDTGGPSWGPNDKHAILNHRLPRVDGPVKVSGAAIYSYDVKLPGMLYGRVLRSPHAHAKVVKIDVSGAKRIPGVRAVVEAGADVRYEGAPVAAVAAISPEIADDAIHALLVQYEVLPHVVTADAAVKPGAPRVFPDGNLEEKEKKAALPTTPET